MKTHRLLFTVAFATVAFAQSPIVPDRVIPLFNGKDLSAFYTWNRDHGRQDPNRVFQVVQQVEGAPAIRISGENWGGIVTKERYANYHLVVEFRWGLVTWEPRRDRTRDSGILLHMQGEDGNNTADFRAPWSRSVEYQIIEGGTGDLILVAGFDRGQAEATYPTLKTTIISGTRRYSPTGEPVTLMKGQHRTDWVNKDPGWKDVLGFRGRNDVEKPVGEWNKIEAICSGGDVTFLLNGVKVNEGRDGSHREGKILIQSEGAELYVRKIELHPLKR